MSEPCDLPHTDRVSGNTGGDRRRSASMHGIGLRPHRAWRRDDLPKRGRMSTRTFAVRAFDQRRWSEVAPLWSLLALLGAGAWIYTVSRARDMGVGPGTMGMAFVFFATMWVAMMAAMMLPAIGPLAAEEGALVGGG